MITILAVLTVLSALTFISQKRLALYLYRYLTTKLTDNRSLNKRKATTEKAPIENDELKGKQRKNFNPVTCVDETKRLEKRAGIFALMCCLFYAATMIGHFQSGTVAQAILATLGVIAAGSYSVYFHVKKQEALIAIEVHHKCPAPRLSKRRRHHDRQTQLIHNFRSGYNRARRPATLLCR